MKETETDWQVLLKETHDYIRASMGKDPLMPAEDAVRVGRDERDAELMRALLRVSHDFVDDPVVQGDTTDDRR